MSYGWIWACIAAIVFTGLRGFHRKRAAGALRHHQHVHLLATVTTMLLAAGVVLIRLPEVPERWLYLATLSGIAGVGYALAGVCNLGAVRHLKLSTFQSASKLSAFLPVLVFHFVLGEAVSATQSAGILLAAFPIMMLAFVEPSPPKGGTEAVDPRKGIVYLVLYIALTSSLQIVNVLAVKKEVDFSLGTDPFLFVLCTNLAACPVLVAMIRRSRERVALDGRTLRHGAIAGWLNVLAFGSYLVALEIGPASSIVPLYSYNTFVSVALYKAFPGVPTAPTSRRALVILLFLLGWGAVSIVLLIKGTPP